DITGLTNGTTFFVITDGTENIKLASSRENALKGKAIDLTPGGGTGGTGHSLTEAIHGAGARAVSGASGGKHGAAGSAARDTQSGSTEGQLLADAVLTSRDGNDAGTAIGAIAVNATSATYSLATANPKSEPASGKSLGLGLSFAINVSNYDTRTTMEETAAVVAANDLSLIANSSHAMATQAKAGAKSGSDGTAFAGAVALGVTLNDTSSRVVGDDPTTPETPGAFEVDGDLTVTATGLENIRTEADADTKGADTGFGVGIGLGWIADDPDVGLERA